MESFKAGDEPVSFPQRMLRNKFLLLTVLLAITAAAYIAVGMIRLVGH